MFDASVTIKCLSTMLQDPDKIIEQFTGLLDKNGKEIYEGDVLGTHTTTEHTGTLDTYLIAWSLDAGLWIGRHHGLDKAVAPLAQHAEVIGNIHQNPELLSAPVAETNSSEK